MGGRDCARVMIVDASNAKIRHGQKTLISRIKKIVGFQVKQILNQPKSRDPIRRRTPARLQVKSG
jgi:hypothetical protein